MQKKKQDVLKKNSYFQKIIPGKRTKILDYLAEQGDSGCCLQDIEKNTSITYKTLKSKISELEKVGMVRVLTHTGNREPYVLTDQGKRVLRALENILK